MVLHSNFDKCLICRKLLEINKTKLGETDIKISTKKTEAVFTAWKRECATAICHVLFGKNIDYIVNYLQNAHYCSGCEQLVRDVGYVWKQIQSFQNRISELSSKMYTLIDLNYQMIEAKSQAETTQERISCLLNTTAPLKVAEYSYEEMVEIIYSVVSTSLKSDLKGFACSESSFSNNVGIHPDSLTFGSSYDSVNEVKEEYSDSDMEQQVVDDPFFNEDAHNYVPIKSDFDESNESVEGSGFENHEDLHVNKYVDDDTNSSSEHEVKEKKRKQGRPKLKLNKKKKRNLWRLYSCDEEGCESQFTCEANKQLHIRKMHKGESKPYKCVQCEKKFTSSDHLKRHVNHVHEEGRVLKFYSCKFCCIKYIELNDLTSHYSTSHQEPNPFKCAFCPELFPNNLDLTKHTKQSHHQPNVCKVCDAVFLSPVVLNSHEQKRHIGKAEWPQCSICGQTRACKASLKVHMKTHEQSTLFKCDICQLEFKSLFQLKSHSQLHVEGEFACNVCGMIVPNLYDLKAHESTHKSKRIRRIIYDYKCKFCCKGYFKEEELNDHYAVAHLEPNPFSCAFCSHIYSNFVDLQKHMKTVHPDPNSGKRKCKTCGLYFANKSSLCVHQKTHLDPSFLFKCDLCAAVFNFPYLLKTHMETHSDKTKYVCDKCGKAYKTSTCLFRHSKTHDENQRKHACKICGKKFFSSSHCKNHERCHSNIKEFVCHICGKGFNRDCNLNEHLKIHAGVPTRRRPKLKLKSVEANHI